MTSILTHNTMLKATETALPDSTTTFQEMSEFCTGQDVLVKQKDGRFYFGTVVEVDSIREQCLVKFGDNTDNWALFKDLTKLSSSEQEDLLCVVCKKSAPKRKKEITVCHQCGRGYHQKCHLPEIPTVDSQKDESSWICKRCTENQPHRMRKSENAKNLRRDSLRNTSADTQILTSTTVKALPYELSSLNWDTYHRVNSEQIYCYCGEGGEWYKQMLQCSRCKQWFHERCIECLQFPLYCGDRFYVFVCSICNQGRDFVRRLEMKWVDLVHLMLFNLTVYNCKKYYDLDTVVLPYITDNWHGLQLPPKIANVTKSERRENILSVLTNNRNRFKCGREIKKRTTIWGLRVRLPPPAPCVTLPQNGRVTEEELREMWQGNRRLQFLSRPQGVVKNMIGDVTMKNLMMGVAYQQHHALSESESPCPSPEIGKEEDIESVEKERVNTTTTKFVAKKNEYLGAGCAKKTAPFKKMSLQRRKKLLALTNRERERILKRPKRLLANCNRETNGSGDNVSQSLPPTPPTSVSAPPTPPASNATSTVSDLSNDFLENEKLKGVSLKKGITGVDFEPNTPCDTSGDETSSKSTLDLIIPPPKDFEGKNNPFLALLRGNNSEEQKKGKKSKEITLPLPLKTVIPGKPQMRPMKRQLSEKDIVIGPNGQIKRRKRVRRTRNATPNYVASKTATIVPVKPSETKEWKNNQNGTGGASTTGSQLGHCMDYTFNGRRLRQRPEKPPDKEKSSVATPNSQNTTSTNTGAANTTPKPSPVKQEPNIDMEDLKTSVNMYFGAANRIALGERFAVRAKRTGPAGKMEYLIEWEGPSNTSMT